MRKYISAFMIGFVLLIGGGTALAATLIVSQGGTGKTILPLNMLVVGNGKSAVTSTSSPAVGYIHATSTTGTSTLPNLNISGTLKIGSEYLSNFTTYVRSLFSAGTGISISSGQVSFSPPSNAALSIPYASTTAITATSASTTNLTVSSAGGSSGCATFNAAGTISNVGSPCASSGASIYSFTPSTIGGTQVSATSTALNDTAGYFDDSWRISSSTVVCASHCQYSDIQTAIAAGERNIQLKAETYTLSSGITIPANNVVIIGAGRNTLINFNAATVPVALTNSNYASQRTNLVFKDFRINQTGTAGTGTCMDFTKFAISTFENVDCSGANIGFIASTTNTHYNTFIHPTISVTGVGSRGFSVENNAIFNTLINPRIVTGTDSTGIYVDAHAFRCVSCNVETNALIGMDVGANADDVQLDVYLEGNQTNLRLASGIEAVNVTGFIADGDVVSGVTQDLVDNGAIGLQVNARIGYQPHNYISGYGSSFAIGTSSDNKSFNIETGQNAFFVTSTTSASNISVGAPTFASPKNTSVLFLGSGFAGNESTAGYGADDSSANIRFNGSGIAWGDFGYYPNSGSVTNSYGTFRLSTAGTNIDSTPNAKLGVGSFFADGRVGFSTTSPWGKFTINLNNKSVPQGNNAFLIASSTQTSTTTLFSVDNTGAASTTLFYGAQLRTCNSGNVLTWAGGQFGCAADATSVGASPFTWGTNNFFSTSSAATTTSLSTQGVFLASSTAAASQFPFASSTAISTTNASTTNLVVSGATTLAGIVNGANRVLFINSAGTISGIGLPISTANGGTNSAALSGSMLLGTNVSGSTVVSTSTPTLDHLVATGTIASLLPYASTTMITSTTASTSILFLSIPAAFTTGDSAVCFRAGGLITVDGGVSSCIVSSRTVKHDIVTNGYPSALARFIKLAPVTFAYNDTNKEDIGLIAEDVSAIDPRYAQYSDTTGKPRAINWSAIEADIIQVLQNVLARLDGDEKKLQMMQEQINNQQKEIDDIKAKLK